MNSEYKSLRIEEDSELQKRAWKVQRIVWGIMFLFVIIALIGATGKVGILSKVNIRSKDWKILKENSIKVFTNKIKLINGK